MNFSSLDKLNSQVIHSQEINGTRLEVRDAENYRWFNFGGSIIQSLMNKNQTEQVIMPVCQAMLMFLLWQDSPKSILNLGTGGATFERFFSKNQNVDITSVDNSAEVIDIAKRYFYLPNQVTTHCQQAEEYLTGCTQRFDVILCDIFSEQKNVFCINQISFYQRLSHSVSEDGIVSINLDPENEANLITILHAAGRYFSNIALIEFNDFKNIVMLLSFSQIPYMECLLKRNHMLKTAVGIDFSIFISSMHLLPPQQLTDLK
ncbi:hypothetical protein [Thalassotalea atypica]|uniref:spermine/spermidine synthase domain-containing protein n=1 Tax=Thalassotalea atypica TaxID=2054316 RepID=UPI00257315F6|nr:hypothetical protein [Thalassotalea atypica]